MLQKHRPTKDAWETQEEDGEESQHPPTARATKSPVFLGTHLTPGVEAGESYRTPVDHWDWYNDFQSSESDSVDPYVPAVRPSLILASLPGATGREEPADRFWGGPVYGLGLDGAEPYGEQPDQEEWYSDMDSAGSYDPYLDDHRGDTDYGETEECSDVCLQSNRGSDCKDEAPMEVEEYPHRDLPSHVTPKAQKARSLQHPRHRPGHATQSLSFPLLPCSHWPMAGCLVLRRRLLVLVSGPQPGRLAHRELHPERVLCHE
ncbi:hypothetical protein P4O66_004318 [Electrophorus voltai]|uniref:Uncharacterized protein n=1 Tax=Electrophorus voltai TaxID=2609070 RepID=A0AAD8YQF9_9TELE|nr:hypothetical protein P4O66_004318 [Electrophorus voltai]